MPGCQGASVVSLCGLAHAYARMTKKEDEEDEKTIGRAKDFVTCVHAHCSMRVLAPWRSYRDQSSTKRTQTIQTHTCNEVSIADTKTRI